MPVKGMPLKIAFGYERSYQALFLRLPLYRYVLSVSYLFNKYLTGTVDVLSSKDYSAASSGSYATGINNFATVTGTNRWNRAAVFELGAHF